MRWLPTRAYENGVYAIYSNPIGVDGGTIKPVCKLSSLTGTVFSSTFDKAACQKMMARACLHFCVFVLGLLCFQAVLWPAEHTQTGCVNLAFA